MLQVASYADQLATAGLQVAPQGALLLGDGRREVVPLHDVMPVFRAQRDRLRAIIADLDWSAISDGMVVTISAGVTMLRADDASDNLLARADTALYRAKDLGRNNVVRV